MLLIALTPATEVGGSISTKLVGVVLASLSSGGGELSFLGLTHYYGHFSLAAWSSGTGGAGLVGAGLYVLLTTWIGFTVSHSLLASAFLPIIMLVSFFVILPLGPLKQATHRGYHDIPSDNEGVPESDDLLSQDPLADPLHSPYPALTPKPSLATNLLRARALFLPYMLPLLLVYIAEYTTNQSLTPTLLFPIPSTPFSNYRSFYPTYALIYQAGVFISRSSTPFIRVQSLYTPSLLQVLNFFLLLTQALWYWIPSIWFIFVLIFWEGLLGGAVYVNTFARIMDEVPATDREFSLGATSVSDSAGICIAGLIGLVLEGSVCSWQVERGRGWCREL
jgi:battenin